MHLFFGRGMVEGSRMIIRRGNRLLFIGIKTGSITQPQLALFIKLIVSSKPECMYQLPIFSVSRLADVMYFVILRVTGNQFITLTIVVIVEIVHKVYIQFGR